MSTQINFHVRLNTSDNEAVKVFENNADLLKMVVTKMINSIIENHLLVGKVSVSFSGPEVVSLRD